MVLERVGDWSYFGEVVEAGSHARALRMVAEGVVDGAAIDCHVLAVELRDHPDLADRLRVVDTLGPAPIQPVVVRSSLPSNAKEELYRLLSRLSGPVLERFFVERFAPAPDYTPIARALAGAVRREGRP